MSSASTLTLKSLGHNLDTSPEAFGSLRDSSELLSRPEALRARMQEDGYLYLPGYLNRAEVLDTRLELLNRIAKDGVLDPAFPVEEGVCLPTSQRSLRSDLAKDNAPMLKMLYSGPMMGFYEKFLGGEVLHYDYTWIRTVAPGHGTPAHYDVVYMGRGTKNLFTAWVPLGDTDLQMGGLMILEGSHKHEGLKAAYGSRDVDQYCINKKDADKYATGEKWWDGWLSRNPVSLRKGLGGRWLTNDFKAGDLLTFSMFTVHASLDNQSNRFRLSTDSRYQLKSEPVDSRWVGENPPGHGPAGKRGKIC